MYLQMNFKLKIFCENALCGQRATCYVNYLYVYVIVVENEKIYDLEKNNNK